MDSKNNTAIHIYSVEVHDKTEDMCTFQTFSYHMLWNKYDTHVASLYFYMFHICDVLFNQTFCFDNFGFDISLFSNTYHARIAMIIV